MKSLFLSLLVGLLPNLAMASDPIITKELHLKEHGDFTVHCAQYSTDSTFTSWDVVPVTCTISLYPKRAGIADLGSIEIYADRVDFNLYRDSTAPSFGGYSIEQRGKTIWTLPPAALNRPGNHTPIAGGDRAVFLHAMTEAAKKRGTLRLNFKLAYSGNAAPIDLEIPLRKWTAALRGMKRTTRRLGEPTAPWGGK